MTRNEEPLDLPVSYHKAFDEQFDAWAFECGCPSETLRKTIEAAIRTRREQAYFERQWHKANGKQPNVYCIDLGLPKTVKAYFTLEEQTVVIRGVSWETPSIPRDDFDGGGFYTEPAWLRRG